MLLTFTMWMGTSSSSISGIPIGILNIGVGWSFLTLITEIRAGFILTGLQRYDRIYWLERMRLFSRRQTTNAYSRRGTPRREGAIVLVLFIVGMAL